MRNTERESGSDTTGCPKCGFHREAGRAECMSCGLIFDRYRPKVSSADPVQQKLADVQPSPFRRAYRIFRWVALAGTLVTVALILRNSPPPDIQTSPDAGLRAETKIGEFQSTRGGDVPATLQLDEAELNAWVRSRLPSADEETPPVTPVQPAPQDDSTVEQVRSNVRDIRLHLDGDNISAYVLFDFHGKEISLILEGKLELQEGCLRMVPTAGKLGSLPLMEATLRGAASRLFDSTENREKFCLPPGIRDVRIEEGNLVVASR